MSLVIKTEPLLTNDLSKILNAHWEFCTSITPPEHVYALDATKLFAPGITVFGAYIDEALVGIGAIRLLDSAHAELKSMHTFQTARGQGIGRAMVLHIEEFARSQGINRLSLETGTHPAFAPARNLYASLGFSESLAFGNYVLSEDNMCMTKELLQSTSD